MKAWKLLSEKDKLEIRTTALETVTKDIVKLSRMVDEGKLSSTAAQRVFNEAIAKSPAYILFRNCR